MLPWFFDIPDLNLEKPGLAILVDVDVDREMGVDISHLVPETSRDTNDQVVDERSDCSESSDVFARTVVHLDDDLVFLRVCEADCQVLEALHELAYIIVRSRARIGRIVQD